MAGEEAQLISRRDDREHPSAMLDEIDTAARRIWFVSPKRSSSGNLRVKE